MKDQEVIIKTTERKRKALLAFLDRVTIQGRGENAMFMSIASDLEKPVTDFKEVEDTSQGEEGG